MGKAVVATDVDGFKEVISNEKTGIIVSRHILPFILNFLLL